MRRQDSVTVQRHEKGPAGKVGQTTYVPVGDPIPVPCNVYPADADIVEAYGLQKIETRHVVGDAWPGDLHSTITFEGATWDPATPVSTFGKTPSARSVQLHIKKRGE